MHTETADQTKVRDQLERLVASAEISRTQRMARFLRYVAEKSLAGDQEALRERQIGIAVFDRPKAWDPKLDNIVRSEARRLRGRLESYAARNDPDETVRITMPTGGYGLLFEELASRPSGEPALADPAEDVSQGERTTSPPTRRIGIVSLAALAVVLALAFYVWQKPQPAGEHYRLEPFSSEAGLQFSPAVSPNGKEIAFVWDGDKRHFNLYRKNLGSSEAQQLTQLGPSSHPAWSPDGRQVAFLRDSEFSTPEVGGEVQLLTLDVSTLQERLIRRMHNDLYNWGSTNLLAGCQALSWAPDGDHLVLTEPSGQSHGLTVISLSTGEQRRVTVPNGSDEDCFAKVSRDGRTIAFIRLISHAAGYLYTVDIDGNNLRKMLEQPKDLRGLDWTHDGKGLIFASKDRGAYQLWSVPAQGGSPIPVAAATASASDPSVSPDGAFVAFVESHENWNLWRVALGPGGLGTPQRFSASTGKNHSPSYSPDGRQVAFVSDRSGDPEIWFSDADGQHLRQVTHFQGPWLGTIRWSPDARSIVFDARPNGHSAIYTLDVANGKTTLFESQAFEVRRPSWSRDGHFIYFDTTRNGVPGVWRRDLRTGKDQAVATAGFMLGTESSDGKRLFFEEHEGRQVWMSDPDGRGPLKLTGVQPSPDLDWTPSANLLLFASAADDGADLMSLDLTNGNHHFIGHIRQKLATGTPSFSVSPDGKYLLYATLDNNSSEIKLRVGSLPR